MPFIITLTKVKCVIDKLDITIKEAKHDVFDKIAKTIFAGRIKKSVAQSIVDNIVKAIEPFNDRLNTWFSGHPMEQLAEKANEQLKYAYTRGQEVVREQVLPKMQEAAETIKEKAKDAAETLKEKAKDVGETLKEKDAEMKGEEGKKEEHWNVEGKEGEYWTHEWATEKNKNRKKHRKHKTLTKSTETIEPTSTRIAQADIHAV